MKKTYLVFWVLFLGAVLNGQAQKIVQGIVRDASTKEALPGVTVSLKGTENGTSTNMQGAFQLVIPHDTVNLRFSFIGFITVEKKIIFSEDTLLLPPVLLKEDCIIDLFYTKHLEISVLSGLKYTPLGGRIKAFYPYLINAKNSAGSLKMEFSYQAGNNNYQRNATLALDNIFLNCANDLSITADYQKIRLSEQKFSYTRYTVGAMYSGALVGKVMPVYLAFGWLNAVNDGIIDTNTGFEIGTTYFLPIHKIPRIEISGRVAWWQNYWQFRIGAETEVRRFTVGVNFNKLSQYAEVTTRVGFKIQRRLHKKN